MSKESEESDYGAFVFFIVLMLLVVIFIFVILYNKILFIPSKKIKIFDNHNYDNIFVGIKTKRSFLNNKIRGEVNINMRHYRSKHSKGVILYLHGNTGNISHRSYVVEACDKFLHLNLLLVDYRGYGLSDGSPGPRSILEDGETAYKYLLTMYHPDKIIVWGESMGGAVATWIAHRYKIRSLILLSTFSCICDIAEGLTNKRVSNMLSRILKVSNLEINIEDWIQEVECPVLMIHSTEDTLIPYKSARKNYNRIKTNHKKFITIRGDHPNPVIREDQFKEILSFLGIKRVPKGIKKMFETVSNKNWD